MTIMFKADKNGGVFRHPAGYDKMVQELDDALDDRDAGRISIAAYIQKLKLLVERHPDFIDGHAHLGNALFEEGKTKSALSACLQGAAIGESVISQNFRGTIEWGHLDNRPFLRAMHGAALCHLKLGQRQKAVALMEKMLKWNPGDNQGVRYLVGSEYFRLGRTDEARAIFEAEAAYYPPYRYELALLLWKTGDRCAAATNLRLGFVENFYIAEMLCGNPEPRKLAIWHGTNFAEPEVAHDYIAHGADLWRRTPDAIAFLHWLYTHPKILAERAAVLQCREELLWEHESDQRRLIIAREETALHKIDGSLSEELIRDRTDHYGRPVSPWLYTSRPR
jgi:tetratricopeptide (TPR) repeat protein